MSKWVHPAARSSLRTCNTGSEDSDTCLYFFLCSSEGSQKASRKVIAYQKDPSFSSTTTPSRIGGSNIQVKFNLTGKLIMLLLFLLVNIWVRTDQDARFLPCPFSYLCSFRALLYIKKEKKLITASNLNGSYQLYLHGEYRYIGGGRGMGETKPKKAHVLIYDLIYHNFCGLSKIFWNSCCTYCADCTPPWLNEIFLC